MLGGAFVLGNALVLSKWTRISAETFCRRCCIACARYSSTSVRCTNVRSQSYSVCLHGARPG